MDPGGRNDLLDLLDALHASGKTIILVSHSMEDVVRRAKMVFVLSKGKLVRTGSPLELFGGGVDMEEYGLALPQMARLRETLRERGIDVPSDTLTQGRMADALIRLWKSRMEITGRQR